MADFELLDTETTFEDMLQSNEDSCVKATRLCNVAPSSKNVLLSSMLFGAAILTPTIGIEASDILMVDRDNHIEYSENYYKLVYEPFIKYMDNFQIANNSKPIIIRDILGYKALNNSWDGYGAVPLEIESAVNTIELINYFSESTVSSIHEYYPNPNGTITLEWENLQEEVVSVEIGNNMMSYYVEFSSQETEYYNDVKINSREFEKLSNFIEVL